MKKLILLAMLVGATFGVQAQKIAKGNFSKNAIGIRLAGSFDGRGADVSYQRAVLTNNRLEFDLGVRNNSSNRNDIDAVKLAALFQWVFNIEGGFNWYVGAGGGLGSYKRAYNKHYYDEDYYYNNGYRDDKGVFVFVAGDIGLEYNFDIPLQLAVDFRPEVGSNQFYDDTIGADVGIAIRYRF